jgi:hypothetical protein
MRFVEKELVLSLSQKAELFLSSGVLCSFSYFSKFETPV